MPEKESQSEKNFPDWNNLYSSQNVETMPWYNENLDSDLEVELERRKISKGRILDLGTGPATHIKSNNYYSNQNTMQIALSINHVPLSSYGLAAPQDEDAESEGIDLIVIGTKGTSNIKNMLLW